MPVFLHEGDCLSILKILPSESIDSVVTDPPYGISSMGRKWDHDVPSVEIWQEVLRVLKPGGHLLSFSGTRTYHRMVVAIEDAGFEIRDQIGWLYGSGFPKSLDVSKAIDKAAGVEREVTGNRKTNVGISMRTETSGSTFADDAFAWSGSVAITAPATPEAKGWQGWGTALKPAWEPIVVARKPLIGTAAENVLMHGTGALNIGECRVETISQNEDPRCTRRPIGKPLNGGAYGSDRNALESSSMIGGSNSGRWPANIIHDGSDEVMEAFAGFGERPSGGYPQGHSIQDLCC